MPESGPVNLPSARRKPRFRRVETRGFTLTERDVAIIRHVWRHRFLRSSHLIQLLEGSPQAVLRRLQLLYHAGFLDRPRNQLEYFAVGGSRPIVYGLGNRGAELLRERLGIARERLDWNARNRAASRIHLEHTLLVSDVMVAFEVACQRHGSLRIIDADEIAQHAPARGAPAAAPLHWSVSVRHEGRRHSLGVVPDKIFGLHFTREPEGKNRSYFFLEADRGTMPVASRTLERASVLRKLIAYRETWLQGLHTKHFTIRAFRVLTVTSAEARCGHLVDAAEAVADERTRGLFLFSSHHLLDAQNPLWMPWQRPGIPPTALLP